MAEQNTMTEKPRFKRKIDIDDTSEFDFKDVYEEVIRCYGLLEEAERMATRIEEICDEPQKPWVGFIIPQEIGNEVTQFLERLSK